jgi:hypothetical protein
VPADVEDGVAAFEPPPPQPTRVVALAGLDEAGEARAEGRRRGSAWVAADAFDESRGENGEVQHYPPHEAVDTGASGRARELV